MKFFRLPNSGSDCYINSILQYFLNNNELTNFILENQDKILDYTYIEKSDEEIQKMTKIEKEKEKNNILSVNILLRYSCLIINAHNIQNEQNIVINYPRLRSLIINLYGENFTYFSGQQDSHEFLIKFLNNLTCAFNLIFKENFIIKMWGAKLLTLYKCLNCENNKKECEKKCENKECENECKKECEKECKNECKKECEKECKNECKKECEKECKNECKNKECKNKECEKKCDKKECEKGIVKSEISYDFYSEYLIIGDEENSIQKMFDKFHEKEILNDYKCESCNEKKGVEKITTFSNPPKFLILIIRRFDEYGKKIIKDVIIEKELIIQKEKYELKHFVLHYGNSINSGHYLCMIKANDNKYYLCNDMIINEYDDEKYSFKSNDVYITIYHKI